MDQLISAAKSSSTTSSILSTISFMVASIMNVVSWKVHKSGDLYANFYLYFCSQIRYQHDGCDTNHICFPYAFCQYITDQLIDCLIQVWEFRHCDRHWLYIFSYSFTINDVQTQARYVWAYDRCDIIRTYHARPALFPPFTFFISALHFGYRLWKKLYRICFRRGEPYKDQSQCFSKEYFTLRSMFTFTRSLLF